MAGTRAERGRCWDYLTWLLKQRRAARFTVPDLEKRDDCTELRIPRGAAGRVQGSGGATLRSIERETKTFCFLTPDRDDPDGKEELVLIFGVDKKRRYRALDLIEDAMSGRYRAREREDERGGRRRDGSRDGDELHSPQLFHRSSTAARTCSWELAGLARSHQPLR